MSAYQKMAVLAVVFSISLVLLLRPAPAPALKPDVLSGMLAIWSPSALLGFQAFGLFVFYVMGRSRVTGSTIAFHVRMERI